MGRLTRKHESGEFYLPRRYKDENGNNIVPSNQDAINKLAHYEDLEEQGRLIELKHGKWLLECEPDGTPYCFHCSVCDDDFRHIDITTAYKYCPNCGAKMESEVAE